MTLMLPSEAVGSIAFKCGLIFKTLKGKEKTLKGTSLSYQIAQTGTATEDRFKWSSLLYEFESTLRFPSFIYHSNSLTTC